ncbi:MAG: hypothetical protein P8L32_06415, partial [Paracoccaceae bacterium]|nr:hypothetical protein [Paracoccaceae bacterium]
MLSQEGIKLAHRTPDGWAELGHVNLLSDDLPQKLESLRKQGEALAVTDFTTKIVLPNDQVNYLTLPSVDDDQREEAIKAAIERATPYLIEDLVYDWEDGDDGMNIAAVAGATLTEAESFITQYGFNPTSFVAAPDDALFSVEPFFGTCSSYTADDDVSENIEAEVDKVILSASEEAPMAEAVDDTPEEIEAEAEAEKAAQIEITDAITDLAEAEQSDEDEAKPFIAPLVADRDEDVSMAVFPTIGPATSTSILGGMEPRVRPAPRIGIGAEEDRDILDRSFPTWAGEAERDRPFSMDENIEAKKIGWLKAEDAEKDDDTTQPPSWMKTDDAIVEAEPEFEEESEAAAWVAPTVAAPINQPLFDEVDTEAEKLEIFGNRGDRSDKGAGWNPLLIGGIVLALILLIGVSYAGVRYFSSSTQPQIAAPETTIDPVTDPVIAPVAEATPDAQDEVIAQEDTAEPETIIETPAIEVTSDLPEVTATPEAANEELAIEPTSAIAEHDAVTLPDETPTEPLADTAAVVENTTAPAPEEPVQEVNETIAPQTQILTEAPTAAVMAPERPASETPDAPLEADPEAEVITEAIAPAETAPVETVREEPVIADLLERAESDWTTLSVPAREARYAATGIWPIALLLSRP